MTRKRSSSVSAAADLRMARWLARDGLVGARRRHAVRSRRSSKPCSATVPAAEFRGGEFTEALLAEVGLVALSPGLSPTHSPAAPLLKEARRRGVEVVGEIELFARELARLKNERGYAPRVLGVTGTNGKTTTTRLDRPAGRTLRAQRSPSPGTSRPRRSMN